MKQLVSLIVIFLFFISACKTTGPTPLIFGNLIAKNNEVVSLYSDCTEGANYTPTKEGCSPELLEQRVEETMDYAELFISGDIKQPQGYDIYLSKAMILCRISKCIEDDYSQQEKIARQFFEIQKAHSGRSLTAARFYWAAINAGYISWQHHYNILALDSERKVDLILCLAEAKIALTNTSWLDGPRRVRLIQYIQVLELIINSIE